MSDEQPVEPEKPEVEPKPQPDSPWSAPPITEVPEPSVDLEPLTPLKPTLADALGGALLPETEPPAYDFTELFTPQQQTTEGEPRPLLRPVTPISSEYCREGGGLGFCVTCQKFPCSYILGRVFRHLLVKVEYGGTVNSFVMP